MTRRLTLLIVLLATLFSPLPVHAAAGGTQPAGATSVITLADLGEPDLVIKSIFDQEAIDFPLAEGRAVQHATLKLHTAHSAKLLAEMSDLTIGLNDEPVANLILGPDNAAETTINIDLPLEGLRPGDNVLTFRANIRLKSSGCADVGDTDLWLEIFADSAISLEFSDEFPGADLSRFPAPFSRGSALAGSPQVSFVLPDRPTAAELSAAAQIAAVLGQSAGWDNPPLAAYPYSQLDSRRAAADQLIVISSAARNPLAGPAAPGLTELASPYNPARLMLVVSGADDISLLNSAAMLATRSAHGVLSGASVAVRQVEPQGIPQRRQPETFEQLGFETKRIRGIGLHDAYYPIDIPYDWKTTSDASIELRFAHARGMAAASLMTAFINGFQVASVRLDNRNAGDGRLVIQLSPRQVHPGRNWLHLSFDLHMRRENCNYRYREEVWVDVLADKSLANLQHVVSASPLELRYLPASLVVPSDLSSDLFVVPDDPAAADLTAMVRLAAKLGTHTNTDGLQPRAVTAAGFAPEQARKASVIAIGSPEANGLIRAYDGQLPQPLALDTGQIVPATGRALLPDEQNGQAGYIEVLTAPWQQDGTLFVFSARDPALLARTVDVFPTLGHRWKSEGNVAVISPKRVTVLSLGALAGVTLSTPVRLLLAGVLIGLFLFIATVGILVGRYNRSRQQEADSEE
jgi:hypothetical protein